MVAVSAMMHIVSTRMPLARERTDPIAERAVVAQQAANKDGARAEHHHRSQDELDGSADHLGCHAPSSAVLKTVVKRRQ